MPTIRAWLEHQGLGQYAARFEREQIQVDDLPDLSEADLETLGLPMGHRKRVLRAAAEAAEDAVHAGGVARPAARYAPASLAAKILTARGAIEGERKQVTILFADVKGSTELVRDLDAEAVSALFDHVQKVMIGAVHAYEGTVNEVLGDGIMAIFGAPLAHEDHALRACRAALDLQDAIAGWVAQGAPGSPAHSVRLRVGLNSGEVVVRAINNDLTVSYSAMGMTTHLAARMEQSAAPGTIRITENTLRLARGMIEVRPQGEVRVKGVAEPVPVYALAGLGKARTRLEAATMAGLTRLVGRARELRILEERFADAAAGCGQVVSIVGDAGIGKSRLLFEFRTRLARSAAWVEGHALSFGQAMAFHPLIDLLHRNFRIEEQDTPETVRAKVTQQVERIEAGPEMVLPYVFHLLGVAQADDPVTRLDPQVRRAETFNALRHLLLRAAERKPQVLVFEDLHWSDTATREFVSYLIDSIPRSRTIILLTFRPGYDFALGERTYATRLVLPNLTEDEAGEMAGAVFASAGLPEKLLALVQRKAEGNPFFVEEVIKSLAEADAILRRENRWVLGRPLDQIVVPDTIQDVLMSRIDRLDEGPRQALQLAAVIGREFTQRLLDRIAEIRAGTTTALRELQAIELIYEKALFPELAFMFKHALTQDVAYGSLLTQRRRELHRQIGHAIEDLYPDRLAEHSATLAHHFARGEDLARAADYFEKAANQAAASFSVHEALVLFERAIDAIRRAELGATGLQRESDLHVNRGDLCMSLGDFGAAHGAYAQAATLAPRLADRAREGSAIAAMGLASVFAHEFVRGLAEADAASRLADETNAAAILPSAQFTTGLVRLLTGQLDQAEAHLVAADRMARSQNQIFYSANASAQLAFLNNWRGDLDAAISLSNEVCQVARENHLAFVLLQAHFVNGIAYTGRGSPEEALRNLREGLALAEKLHSHFFVSRFLNSLGWLFAECGDQQRAIELNERGVAASQPGDPETLANCELNLGDVFRLRGELHVAWEYFEHVHRMVRKPTTSDWMKWRYSQHLFAGLGEVWLALDDPSQADDCCHQCLELATRTGSKKYLVRGWRLKGDIAMSHLRWEEAEQHFKKALGFAERVGNPTQLWRTHVALGQLYRARHRIDLARASLGEALRVLDGIGHGLHTPELKAGFERSPVLREVREQCETG